LFPRYKSHCSLPEIHSFALSHFCLLCSFHKSSCFFMKLLALPHKVLSVGF
jgi:hypothetical protein